MKVIRGKDIEKYIDQLGLFRIEIFREYPYLYKGNLERERKYLSRYSFSSEGILILMLDDLGILGTCMGLPLKDEDEEFIEPFRGSALDKIFYIGEVMIRKDSRGKRLGKELMLKMLSLIDCKKYTKVCLYTVERESDHPLKTEVYGSSDTLWEELGFKKDPKCLAHYSWRDVGEKEETSKRMNVWVKEIY